MDMPQTITVDLLPEQIGTLDEIAGNMDTDRSSIIREAIAIYLESYEVEKAQASDIDREIESGKYYTHEEAMKLFDAQTKTVRAA